MFAQVTRMPPLARAVALAACLLSAPAALADPAAPAAQPDAPPAPEAPVPADSALGREVPRGAVLHFLDAARAARWAEAAESLDLDALPAAGRTAAGKRLAWHLKVVLDRKLWIDLDALSAEPEGDVGDGLPPGVDSVGEILTSKGPVEIRVQRIAEPDGTAVWKFAGATVRRVPALWDEFGYGALGEVLPPWLFTTRFLDVELWQWVGLALVVVLAWLAAGLIVRLAQRVARPLVRRTATQLDDQILQLVTPPARLALALGLFTAGALALKLSVPVHGFLAGLERGAAVVVVTWVLMRLVHAGTDLVGERFAAEGHTAVTTMVPLARKTLKVVLVGMATIGLLQNVGFNVTGIVAGLGVGGLAVALAAQKTVENLFGGVTLAADRPVRVGDFCRFGDKLGTVEEVGLRSTRVRTLDRTVVSVPNASFSQMELENFALRDKIRLYAVINLRYETTPDQLRWILAELRRLLEEHPRVDPLPRRVRLAAFGASSLDLEIFAYITTTSIDEFYEIREELWLAVMDLVAESGSGFAFPSQTLYLGRDGGLDEQRSRAAEAAARAWREAAGPGAEA